MFKSKEWKKNWTMKGCGGCGGNAGGAIYGIGFLGALYYFLSTSPNAGAALLGVVKAVIWPAIFVFKMLELFKM